MKFSHSLLGLLVLFLAGRFSASYVVTEEWLREFNKTTADRIQQYDYPAERHRVETEDNYIVSMFRIPYSPKLQKQDSGPRPAVFIQHGLTSSSDAWVLSGPDNALAYVMADAGYDVWLGNARGNRYSRNNTRLSPNHPYFWDFSWHEIGVFDISAMLDYICETTNQTQVHYVGHSQGTTVFFVLMSTRPEYNAKIKTAHLLAPVAFMSNMSTLAAKYTRRFVSEPNTLTSLIDTMEVLPSTMFFVELQRIFCERNAALKFMCSNLYLLLNGDDDYNGNGNVTVLTHMNETHPAGASSTQFLHYMQEYQSGRFCQLDRGEKKNLQRYGAKTPPDYDVHLINQNNIHFYYSDADQLAAVVDVQYLATLLPNPPNMFHVPDPTWTHGDFGWATNVKEMINDRIVAACDRFEQLNAAIAESGN